MLKRESKCLNLFRFRIRENLRLHGSLVSDKKADVYSAVTVVCESSIYLIWKLMMDINIGP